MELTWYPEGTPQTHVDYHNEYWEQRMTDDNDYSEADYEEAYGILDEVIENQMQEDERIIADDPLAEVMERERQEDAMDAAQAMEEAELRDEYFRGFNEEID